MEHKHCPHCKRTLSVSEFHKDKSTKSGLRCWCRECCSWKFKRTFLGTEAYKRRLRKYYNNRKEQIAKDPKRQWITYALSNAKRRAKEIGVDFSLTRESIAAVFPDECPLLGTPFSFAAGVTVASSPSLDRKNSSLGYTPDNVWVISAKANRIKSDATTSEIEMVARRLRENGV